MRMIHSIILCENMRHGNARDNLEDSYITTVQVTYEDKIPLSEDPFI